jgi:hypothetical protein
MSNCEIAARDSHSFSSRRDKGATDKAESATALHR